jgi:glycosyltransferase involved in cell wall biosynthesis
MNVYFLDRVSRFLRYKYDIMHLIYGDTQIIETQILFPYRKFNKNKVVATVHLNIREMTLKKINVLRKLDGVVVLSNEQYLLAKELGINACFIPHGFNKPDYCFILPRQNNYAVDETKINIFFSGDNYRDYNMLYCFLNFTKERNDVVVHALGQKNDKKEQLMKFNNIIVWDRMPDNEYYSLLSVCDYNFLPLTFCTANNALMEAQIFGIRSIVSDIAGIKDYTNKEENILFKDEQDLLMKIIPGLKKNPPSGSLKKYSEKFSWDCIYIQLENFYKSLFWI